MASMQLSDFDFVAGSPLEPVGDEEDDGAELEDEEMETVQLSEKEFNFLDFIKR